MAKQLKRKFNGENYYLEAIKKSKYEAQHSAKKRREAGFKARVVKLSPGKYGIFSR